MSLIKTSITIPEELLNEVKKISSNFSALVTDAVKEYIRSQKVKKAISSFGKWEDREKDSIHMVNEMRIEGSRDYAKGTD